MVEVTKEDFEALERRVATLQNTVDRLLANGLVVALNQNIAGASGGLNGDSTQLARKNHSH